MLVLKVLVVGKEVFVSNYEIMNPARMKGFYITIQNKKRGILYL